MKRKRPLYIPSNRLPKSRAYKDRMRFIERYHIGETFGPCTMPPWAGTSGYSDEDIAAIDAMFAEDEDGGSLVQLPLFPPEHRP